MNKNIKYAIGWGAVGMVYMAIGAMNFWLRQPVFGAIILVVGYIWSAVMVFKHGGLYGIDFSWDRADKRMKEADAMLEALSKAMGRNMGPVWDLNEKGAAQLRCRRCGYTEFSRLTMKA